MIEEVDDKGDIFKYLNTEEFMGFIADVCESIMSDKEEYIYLKLFKGPNKYINLMPIRGRNAVLFNNLIKSIDDFFDNYAQELAKGVTNEH